MTAMPSVECRMTNAEFRQPVPLRACSEFGTRHSAFCIWLRAVVFVVVLIALALLAGCKKKKPPLPPPQAQAPTITEPLPQSIPPATEPPPAAEQPPPSPPTTAQKPKPKPRRSARGRKPEKPVEKPAPAPPVTAQQPNRTVIQEGGAAQPPAQQQGELTASVSHDSALHQRMTTSQLLDSTEFNLKSISRGLNADEQAMVSHIRSFEQQSRAATAEGDLERAYNLALKAHLLSDELVKR